jgi:vacuolar-type H+-ATPase subunit E/Vma4
MSSTQLSNNRKSVSEHSQTHFEFKRNQINSIETSDTKLFSKLKEILKKISSPKENNSIQLLETNPERFIHLTEKEKIAIETHEPTSTLVSPRFEEIEPDFEIKSEFVVSGPEIYIGEKNKNSAIIEELGIRRCASQDTFGEVTPRMETREDSSTNENKSKNGNSRSNEFSFQETETLYSKTNGEGTSSSFLNSSEGSSFWDNSFTEDHPVIVQYLNSKPM